MATILIVDDQPVNREFFTTLLSYDQHRLLEACDGAEALARVRAERPDLIVTDILMPTMDGYELVRQLRANPATARIPIILYTAIYEPREARSLAQACGRCYFLPKPTEPEHVLQVVRAALAPPAGADEDALTISEFHSEHLRLLTDTLVRKVTELQQTVARLEQVNRELVLQKYAIQATEAAGKGRDQLLQRLASELPDSVEAARAAVRRLEVHAPLLPAAHDELAVLRRAVEWQAELMSSLFGSAQPGLSGGAPDQPGRPAEA